MIPTTLRAAVRVFPETKILNEDLQEFTVAVDIEGVLHNQKPLSVTTIDVIFVVDNGWVYLIGSLVAPADVFLQVLRNNRVLAQSVGRSQWGAVPSGSW